MREMTKGLNETQTAFTIRCIKAEAWDEGYRDAIDDYGTDIPWGGMTSDANPYRAAAPPQSTPTTESGDDR